MKYTVQATRGILRKKPERMKQRFLVEATSKKEADQKCQQATKKMIFKDEGKKIPILKTHYVVLTDG